LTLTNYIFKVTMEALVTPITYWVVNQLKKIENINVFDRETSFSPFKFK